MRLTWYGHAAFLIEAEGTRIILDPYQSPESGGYAPIDDHADVVVVSHDNERYHSHLGQIRPPFDVVRGLEVREDGQLVRGIRFHAIRVFETPERAAGDEVTILHFRAEELRLVFLGDLGHALSPDEVEPLRGAEIVLIPAGGPPTIDLAEVPALLAALGPRVVIPMHFLTPKINLPLQPVERFLAALPDWPVERAGSSTLELSADTLPGRPTIVLLNHAR